MDGKRAGLVSNRGHGDPNHVDWIDPKLAKITQDHVKTLPTRSYPVGNGTTVDISPSLDGFISDLVDEAEHAAWMKRQLRSKLLFRLEGDDKNAFRTVKCKKSQRDEAEKYVRDKYGDRVVELHR